MNQKAKGKKSGFTKAEQVWIRQDGKEGALGTPSDEESGEEGVKEYGGPGPGLWGEDRLKAK